MNKKIEVLSFISLLIISFNAYSNTVENNNIKEHNNSPTTIKSAENANNFKNTSAKPVSKDLKIKTDNTSGLNPQVSSKSLTKPSLKNNAKFYIVKIYYNSTNIATFNASVKGISGWKGSYGVTKKYTYKEKLGKTVKSKYADFYKIAVSLHNLQDRYLDVDFAIYEPSSIEKIKKGDYIYNIVKFKKFDINKKILLAKNKGTIIKFSKDEVSISRE